MVVVIDRVNHVIDVVLQDESYVLALVVLAVIFAVFILIIV